MSLLDLYFPKHCLVCRRARAEKATVLCVSCAANLATQSYCPSGINNMLEQAKSNIAVSRAFAPFLNAGENGGLINVLYQLKYAKRAFLAQDLVALAAPGLHPFFEQHQFDALVPVPMHFTKVLQRGFNQSKVLAGELSKQHNIPLETQLLRQVKEKITSLENAIRAPRIRQYDFSSEFKKAKRYKHVLLLDDVFTTGSTLAACFEALKTQGIPEISYLTLFYTPLESTSIRLLEL
jgi:Predicted amidophosphoribosyltransferases